MKNSGKNKTNTVAPILGTLAFAASLSTQASIIINEIDYDQPGSDTAEFIELFNTSSSTVSLDGYFIDLINGGTTSVYKTIDLSGFNIGSNGYFVVCSDTSLVANCNYDFTSSTSWFQNGAPDAIALYEGSGVIDSLSYEGDMTGFTEGSILNVADSGSITASLSRLPNGLDSNNNNIDFQLGCITPGSTNISGSGDCSSPAVVPLPPAVLLFGSGMLGLLGFAKRKTS